LLILMAKIENILLLASDYDFFCMEEDSRLADRLYQFYRSLYFRRVPQIVRVDSVEQLEKELSSNRFQLVLILLRHDEEESFALRAKLVKTYPQLMVAFLAYRSPRLSEIVATHPEEVIFSWSGDGEIIPAILFSFEDLSTLNASPIDANQPILMLIEDSVDCYSRYISFLYRFLGDFYRQLIESEPDFKKKSSIIFRRVRLVHFRSLQKAFEFLKGFANNILGVILDGSFENNGKVDRQAGENFLKALREYSAAIPVILQSSEAADFNFVSDPLLFIVHKDDRQLLNKISDLLRNEFGFGNLRLTDRFGNQMIIRELGQILENIDYIDEKDLQRLLVYGYLQRFFLVHQQTEIAQRIIAAGSQLSSENLRKLIEQIYFAPLRGQLVSFDGFGRGLKSSFFRLGSGSVGGKGRGLIYLDRFLLEFEKSANYSPIELFVPSTLILTTEVFADFVQQNNLYEKLNPDIDDRTILNICINSSLPATVLGDLRLFLKARRNLPLAVRSSSLLEDSLFHPFAGIYATKMIPNDQSDFELCFLNLVNAIKFVYSSVFLKEARSYLQNSGHRLEDEKMAVLIQPVVGRKFNHSFYPQISGVGRSFDFYPFAESRPEDGVVMLALGLGKTIVDGENCLRYNPRKPGVLPQFNSVKDFQLYGQKKFYCLQMKGLNSLAYDLEEQYLEKADLEQAEEDGNLELIASTLDWQNERIVDGTSLAGPRLITFAHILKNEVFPLNHLLIDLLDELQKRLACPIEIEFALSYDPRQLKAIDFFLLQLRPMAGATSSEIELSTELRQQAFCYSTATLGNGIFRGIYDIVFVRPENYNPANNSRLAKEIGQVNARLKEENRSCLLIGPGRWGSTDSWLGIPVKWDQISQARVIVELNLPGYVVDPSQGSHFFHNIIALNLAYFTIPLAVEKGFIRWSKVAGLRSIEEGELLVWKRSERELRILVNGKRSEGVIVIE